MDPPAFSDEHPDDALLPAYSANSSGIAPAAVEHAYTADDKTGKPWFTLKLLSRASSATHIPRLVEGEYVSGSVALDLDEDTKIKSVVVSVR